MWTSYYRLILTLAPWYIIWHVSRTAGHYIVMLCNPRLGFYSTAWCTLTHITIFHTFALWPGYVPLVRSLLRYSHTRSSVPIEVLCTACCLTWIFVLLPSRGVPIIETFVTVGIRVPRWVGILRFSFLICRLLDYLIGFIWTLIEGSIRQVRATASLHRGISSLPSILPTASTWFSTYTVLYALANRPVNKPNGITVRVWYWRWSWHDWSGWHSRDSWSTCGSRRGWKRRCWCIRSKELRLIRTLGKFLVGHQRTATIFFNRQVQCSVVLEPSTWRISNTELDTSKMKNEQKEGAEMSLNIMFPGDEM